MWKRVQLAALLLGVFCWKATHAQEEILPKLGVQTNPPRFVLRSLTQIKLDGDKIIAFQPAYREEEREGTFTRMRIVKRTRKVEKRVGDEVMQVDQPYTVRVPYMQTGKQTVLVPAGNKPFPIAWTDARLYRLDGSLVDLATAHKELKQLRWVFLVNNLNTQITPAGEDVVAIVKPGTWILATDKLRSNNL